MVQPLPEVLFDSSFVFQKFPNEILQPIVDHVDFLFGSQAVERDFFVADFYDAEFVLFVGDVVVEFKNHLVSVFQFQMARIEMDVPPHFVILAYNGLFFRAGVVFCFPIELTATCDLGKQKFFEFQRVQELVGLDSIPWKFFSFPSFGAWRFDSLGLSFLDRTFLIEHDVVADVVSHTWLEIGQLDFFLSCNEAQKNTKAFDYVVHIAEIFIQNSGYVDRAVIKEFYEIVFLFGTGIIFWIHDKGMDQIA